MPKDLLNFMKKGGNKLPKKDEKRLKKEPARSRRRSSTRKKVEFVELESSGEEIEDESGDNNEVTVPVKRKRAVTDSKARNTALKRQRSGVIEQETEVDNSEPWIEKYAPQTVSDVAIHAKKVEEIRKSLNELSNQQDTLRLLVVSGPAGSAKSTIIKQVGKELGYGDDKIAEWSSPDRVDGSSLIEAFGEFLNGFIYKKSLKNLILVEELPNIMHTETKQAFVYSLLQWVNLEINRLPPLVLIITEIDPPDADSWTDSIITERILPRRLLEHGKVHRVKTQPTNITLTTKVLKDISVKENLIKNGIPKKELDQAIKEMAQFGDIRSSISSLEFWARWRNVSRQRRRDDLEKLAPPLGREAHLNLFHAIGRVVYGSSKDKQGNLLKTDEQVIQSVLDDWETTNRDGTLSLSIHENFPNAYSSRITLECFESCARELSNSDLLIAKDLSVLASEFSVRGVRTTVRNHEPDENGIKLHKQSVYPREKKLMKAKLESINDIEKYVSKRNYTTGQLMNFNDAVLYDGYYEQLQKHKNRRIGGDLDKEGIQADDDIDSDDDLAPKFENVSLYEVNSCIIGTDDEDIEDSELED